MTTIASLCAGFEGLGMALELCGVEVDLRWYAEIKPAALTVLEHHHPGVPNLGDITKITNPPHVEVVTAGFPCQSMSNAGLRKGSTDDRFIIRDVCRVATETGASWLILENVAAITTGSDLFRGCTQCGYEASAAETWQPAELVVIVVSDEPLFAEREYADCPECGRDLGHGSNIDVRRFWLGAVLAALSEFGWDAEWGTLRASDVGACHQRNRWFCVARHTENERRQRGGGAR
jgi:DNA (cytosine-5)-methyltransferase 1